MDDRFYPKPDEYDLFRLSRARTEPFFAWQKARHEKGGSGDDQRCVSGFWAWSPFLVCATWSGCED